MVNPETVPGTPDAEIHHTMQQIRTSSNVYERQISLPACFREMKGKLENTQTLGEPLQLYADNNWSSGLNKEPWSCVELWTSHHAPPPRKKILISKKIVLNYIFITFSQFETRNEAVTNSFLTGRSKRCRDQTAWTQPIWIRFCRGGHICSDEPKYEHRKWWMSLVMRRD